MSIVSEVRRLYEEEISLASCAGGGGSCQWLGSWR